MQCNVAKINGSSGVYDRKIENSSVRYGRNALNNYNKYIQKMSNPPQIESQTVPNNVSNMSDAEFEQYINGLSKVCSQLDEFLSIPINFELQYQPKLKNGVVDKFALMGAAYEEMEGNVSVSVDEMSNKLKEAACSDNVSAQALDINTDGKIDIGEYSTSILAADMLSSDTTKLVKSNITGKINNKGQTALLTYAAIHNYKAANSDFGAIYKEFNLGKAAEDFKSNLNNLI